MASFNYSEFSSKSIGIIFLKAMTAYCVENNVKITDIVPSAEEINVVLTVNGHEVDFVKTLMKFEEAFDREVEEKARRMQSSKLNELATRVNERFETLIDTMENEIRKTGRLS